MTNFIPRVYLGELSIDEIRRAKEIEKLAESGVPYFMTSYTRDSLFVGWDWKGDIVVDVKGIVGSKPLRFIGCYKGDRYSPEFLTRDEAYDWIMAMLKEFP
jgi:hypothetical protein